MGVPGLHRLRGRVDRSVRVRAERIAADRVAPVEREVGELRGRVDALQERARAAEDDARQARDSADRVARRAQDIHDWVERVQGDLRWTANELHRLTPQVAALESRIADVEQRLQLNEIAGTTTGPERTLLELITSEHQRVRARLTAVAAYEERLRRLEIARADAG